MKEGENKTRAPAIFSLSSCTPPRSTPSPPIPVMIGGIRVLPNYRVLGSDEDRPGQRPVDHQDKTPSDEEHRAGLLEVEQNVKLVDAQLELVL